MKKFLLVAAVLLSGSAMADTVRTSDGIQCSFDADDTPWSLEAYSESAINNQDSSNDYYNRDEDDFKMGMKMTYNFGGPKRLDCDKLYQLELRTKDARVKQLEEQVKAMEAATAANW